MRYIKPCLFICVVFLLSSCSAFKCGTSTGNPFLCQDQPAEAIGDPFLISSKLRVELCSLLADCHSDLSAMNCKDHFGLLDNIDTEIGLTQGSFDQYSDIEEAELKKSITPNLEGFNLCLSGVQSLSCENPLVQKAFDPEKTNPISAVDELIGSVDSCQMIF